MNFIQRGFISIARKPGKTIILLIVVFILGNLIAGAISVKEAVKSTQTVMREKIGVTMSAVLDESTLTEETDKLVIPSIPAETIEAIGQSGYVKWYDYTTHTSLQSRTLKSYSDGTDKNTYTGLDGQNIASFPLYGGKNPEIADMTQGKIKLVQGRAYTEDEIKNNASVLLISKNVASLNNLGVGSTITLQYDVYHALENGKKTVNPRVVKTLSYELTVIGIFEPAKRVGISDKGAVTEASSELENAFYTTNKVINNINSEINTENLKANGPEYGEIYSDIVPVYVLKDPQDLKNFRAENQTRLPKYYKFIDNGSIYEGLAAPMNSMDWIASVVLYTALGATLIILTLLITLFLRDRKHELGIYLSLGEKKVKAVTQIVIEVLAVSVLAISLSVFSGNVLAGKLSQQMLVNQIAAEDQLSTDNSGSNRDIATLQQMGYTSDFSVQDLSDTYSVKLQPTVIQLFYLVGLGCVLVSTLVPILYIVRLYPKKIMM